MDPGGILAIIWFKFSDSMLIDSCTEVGRRCVSANVDVLWEVRGVRVGWVMVICQFWFTSVSVTLKGSGGGY